MNPGYDEMPVTGRNTEKEFLNVGLIEKHRKKQGPGFVESILLMAVLMSLTALSVDTMLPALPAMAKDLGVIGGNDIQLVISMLMLGLSAGQLIFGPLSDSMGRKPALSIGVLLYIAGCLLCLLSRNFTVMMAGRLVQGMGAAGPRSVLVALIRDQFEGRTMARVMSSITSIFIVIPAAAPAIGQGILMVSSWRGIFAVLLALSVMVLGWFVWRQPETLKKELRMPFSPRRVGRAFWEVCRNRVAFGYTLIAGFIMGAFFSYLNSAQQIFVDIYDLGSRFPLLFGFLALALGCASFLNARLVMRFGMRRIAKTALKTLVLLSGTYLAVVFVNGGVSPLWLFVACMLVTFLCVGFLFGNLNAIAMVPMGHIAGTAATVVGSFSTFMAVPLSAVIGQCYNGTILPLIGGFTVLSLLSLGIMGWADRAGHGEP